MRYSFWNISHILLAPVAFRYQILPNRVPTLGLALSIPLLTWNNPAGLPLQAFFQSITFSTVYLKPSVQSLSASVAPVIISGTYAPYFPNSKLELLAEIPLRSLSSLASSAFSDAFLCTKTRLKATWSTFMNHSSRVLYTLSSLKSGNPRPLAQGFICQTEEARQQTFHRNERGGTMLAGGCEFTKHYSRLLEGRASL